MTLLTATGLRKSYGNVAVLKDVDLTVAEGEAFAVIGPNGAGKTTLFRVLTGEIPADAGTIRYRDEEVGHLPAFERVRRGFGRTFQVARVYGDMSVLDNLTVAIECRHRNAGAKTGSPFAWRPAPAVREEAAERLAEMNLWGRRADPARTLAHGDKKRLELALALALEPRLLMLDEPTAGMSPSDRASAVELIAGLKDRHGITILLTEHDMNVVFGLASRIMVLNYGEIIATGAPEAVRADPLVRQVYLGQEAHDA